MIILLFPLRNTYPCQQIYGGYLFFSVKDRNLFHRVDTTGNIFTSGCATRENITNGVHERINRIFVFSVKENKQNICFFQVDTIGNTFTTGCATRENITNGVHEMK